jgi:leucyl-tRNA synthetase
VSVPKGSDRTTLEELARGDERVLPYLDGKTVRKVVVVPDKLVNFVVGA